jgi:phosphate transport system ATP-binding protein
MFGREFRLNSKPTVFETKSLSVFYGDNPAIQDVSMQIKEKQVTAIIGPSGCGKSTLLRCFNRMNDFVEGFRIAGTIAFKLKDIYHKSSNIVQLRQRVGMVFQRPNPFSKSVYKNITWGPKIHGYAGNIDELVEVSLKKAALWDEVKDRLHESAFKLSGGQQQRLCIARTIAMKPEVILMDEPCSALDPKSTARIEDLISELSSEYTIVTVTHNMQQAARISHETAFFYEGRLVEFGNTQTIFTNPSNKQTEDYITGRFG